MSQLLHSEPIYDPHRYIFELFNKEVTSMGKTSKPNCRVKKVPYFIDEKACGNKMGP